MSGNRQKKHCIHCGAELSEGMKFCPVCGYSVPVENTSIKNKWYLSGPFIILLTLLNFPSAIVQIIIRLSRSRKYPKGYRDRTIMILAFQQLLFCSFLIMIAIFGMPETDQNSSEKASVQAESSDNQAESAGAKEQVLPKTLNYPYVITAYDSDITVNENNTYKVSEKIKVFFNEQSNGIKQKIPTLNTHYADGINRLPDARVLNVSAALDGENAGFTADAGSGYMTIKIGKTDHLLSGEHTYTINYLYDKVTNNENEFYFAITGKGWDTIIDHADFHVTMPKEFDKSKVKLYVEQDGAASSGNIKYSVSGNEISGQSIGRLQPGEKIAIKMNLPEGYFRRIKRNLDKMIDPRELLSLLISMLSLDVFLFVAMDNILKNGIGEAAQNEYYPPEKLNSLEAAYIYKGRVIKDDVMSLLYYFVSKGYIYIAPGSGTNEGDFAAVKLKEYDGTNPVEKEFFNQFFANASRKDVVYPYELKDRFVHTLSHIESVFRNSEKDLFFRRWTKSWLAGICLVAFNSILLLFNYGKISITIGIFLAISIIAEVLFMSSQRNIKFLSAMFFLQAQSFMAMYALNYSYLIEGLILFSVEVSIFAMVMLILKMRNRTEYGQKMFEKIAAFEKSYKNMTPDQMNAILTRDPQYARKILPYVITMGNVGMSIREYTASASAELVGSSESQLVRSMLYSSGDFYSNGTN